ncbi:anaphase-promoting complex subunit 2 [Histomonas meleagridis]|uniref:anaphase-promoting complex subunit 2 n=1 Tax=Histomonas meleagridis TaxID=135588 RepID=UPI00355AC7E0|nr:anaphase-promoting complex subunit 2 [Histomonas meleagridis]KAH0796317.1 anaphase-promoting complex subunit 2 [Histomonas meleagridis]
MNNLHEFKTAVVLFNPDLDNEIQSLLLSLLLINFENGINDFKFFNNNDISLNQEIYDAFTFCGLIPQFRSLIVKHIKNECLTVVDKFSDNYEESALAASLEALSNLIKKYQNRFPDIIKEKRHLKQSIYKKVISLRSNQIFDIVTLYPDSEPALIDLKKCCSQTSAFKTVAETTVKIFITRLLHLGASTSDIVTQYISAIQALNIVDESGGLTRAVSPPIQQYLTTRNDLLDTIVNRILEDDTLVASDISAQKPNDDDVIREANAQKDLDLSWNPEPLHSHIKDPESLIHGASDSDALALLLHVYGSVSSFITQLEKELSRRIETSAGFRFDNEVRAIELLKKRFGSQSFMKCEVILKDVADSKHLAITFDCDNVQPLIISHMYWPPIPNESLKLPNEISEEIHRYTEEFEHLKHPRKLKWHNTVGTVELELEFEEDETIKINVSPLYASVILLMNEYDKITTDIVIKELEVTRKLAESALNFWVSNNIFVKDGNEYMMSETKPLFKNIYEEEFDNNNDEMVEEEEEEDPYIRDAALFVRFVVSILQNRIKEIITLKRLYELMKKFIQFPKFNRTYEQYMKMIMFLVEKGLISVDEEEEVVKLLDENVATDIQNLENHRKIIE